MVQSHLKTVEQFLIKLNLILPYDLATTFLKIYLEELKTYPHKHLQIDAYNSFIIIAKTWKQPRCPSVGEWVNELTHQTMEYYKVLKRNELLSHDESGRT